MFKVNNKNTSKTSFWYFYWTYFTPFSGSPIVDFGQVNASWGFSDVFRENRFFISSSFTCLMSLLSFCTPWKHHKTRVFCFQTVWKGTTKGNIYSSKAAIETLEKVRNMFKVNTKTTVTTSMTSFLCFY